MHEFTDTKGRPWKLDVNVDTIEQVKAACDVNLLDLADPDSGLMREVNAFPPLIGKLLFAALADQAKAKEVDEREFKRSMSGDTLAAATDAILDEIVLFCPSHRRKLLQAVLDKNREVEEAGTALMMARLSDPGVKEKALAAMDREVTARLAEALEKLGPPAKDTAASPSAIGSSSSAGLPPAFSASSIQAPIPGDA